MRTFSRSPLTLCGLSVLVGVLCHIQATSRLFAMEANTTGWAMVLALLTAAGCQRVLAWLQQSRSREWEAAYLAPLTAGSLLVAVACCCEIWACSNGASKHPC